MTDIAEFAEISDENILHVWRCDSCNKETVVNPWFYTESGIPFCECMGDDMLYVKTLIKITERQEDKIGRFNI